MMRSPYQAVKFKRRALGWTVAKLAAESKRTVEEIHHFESGDSDNDELLTAELAASMDNEIARLLPHWERVVSDPDLLPESNGSKTAKKLRLVEFGKLLRDRRDHAMLTRLQLGKLTGISDATVKFIETARHPPSRRTCQALVGVKELGLTWDDVATLGYVGPAPTNQTSGLAMQPEQAAAPDRPEQADSPAEQEPDIPEQTNQDSSTSVDQTSASGDVIEEEIFTFVRRTIRKK